MAPGATVALHYTATLARLPSPSLRSEGLTLLTSCRQCNRLSSSLHLDQLNLRYDEKSSSTPPFLPITGNRLIIPASEPFPFFFLFFLQYPKTENWCILYKEILLKFAVYYYREGRDQRELKGKLLLELTSSGVNFLESFKNK